MSPTFVLQAVAIQSTVQSTKGPFKVLILNMSLDGLHQFAHFCFVMRLKQEQKWYASTHAAPFVLGIGAHANICKQQCLQSLLLFVLVSSLCYFAERFLRRTCFVQDSALIELVISRRGLLYWFYHVWNCLKGFWIGGRWLICLYSNFCRVSRVFHVFTTLEVQRCKPWRWGPKTWQHCLTDSLLDLAMAEREFCLFSALFCFFSWISRMHWQWILMNETWDQIC